MPSPTGIAHGLIDIQAAGGATTKTLADWVGMIEAVAGVDVLENHIRMVSSTGSNPPDFNVVSPASNMNLVLKPKGNGSVAISGNTGPPIIGEIYTPPNPGANGARGSIAWDAQYIYVATGTNAWKRVAVAAW